MSGERLLNQQRSIEDALAFFGLTRSSNLSEIAEKFKLVVSHYHPQRCKEGNNERTQARFKQIVVLFRKLRDHRANASRDNESFSHSTLHPTNQDMCNLFQSFFGERRLSSLDNFLSDSFPEDGPILCPDAATLNVRRLEYHASPQSLQAALSCTGGILSRSNSMLRWDNRKRGVESFECSLEELYEGCRKLYKVETLVFDEFRGQTQSIAKILEIPVSPGWKRGTRVTYSQVGHRKAGKAGEDIILEMREREHECFRREGDDLLYRASITLQDALIGFELQIRALDSRQIVLRVQDTVVSPNTELVIRGEGMPLGSDRRHFGNLRITFEIQFPDHLLDKKSIQSLHCLSTDPFWDEPDFPPADFENEENAKFVGPTFHPGIGAPRMQPLPTSPLGRRLPSAQTIILYCGKTANSYNL